MKIKQFLEDHKEEIISDIIRLAEAESPSADKASVDRCAAEIAELFKERVGAVSEVHERAEAGNCLRTTVGSGAKKIILLGHFDTVHAKGSVPIKREEHLLWGPGVIDMKGGDVAIIWALKALREAGTPFPDSKSFVVVNNSDEEIGSRASTPLILESAKGAAACIVCEPAELKTGKYKISRKGGGHIMIRTKGRAAHSGSSLREGINANLELAHQMLWIASQTEHESRSSFSPNIISGGSLGNIVSDHAEARVDWRMYSPDEVDRVKALLAARGPVIEGASVEYEVNVGRMPFPETDGGRALLKLLTEVGADLGVAVEKAETSGGISDGNDVANIGVPTIDGMGMFGDDQHNPNERLYLDHLVERVAMLAEFMRRV